MIPKNNKSYAGMFYKKNSRRQAGFLEKFMHEELFTPSPRLFLMFRPLNTVEPREDKGDREGIPHTHPIP